jgi:hypothetical protein
MALYYPLSAGLVLFTNILSNPQDQHVASDLDLMDVINSFITNFIQPGTSFAATPTLTVFKELYSIATRFVERVSHESNQNIDATPPQAQLNLQAAGFENDLFATEFDPVHGGDAFSGGEQDIHSIEHSQEYTNDSPLQFAPFVTHEQNQTEHDTPMYNSVPSNTGFEWGMGNMWLANFGPDTWDSADPIELAADFGVDHDLNC